ncbi:MAG: SAM-dependent DNA methyltransferase [Schwartzia succinivorans]|uniref:type I restriction-modification system subunit M n=1 Tax=Schwartzia succinivorans TaxID=55507 RepID=UPI0023553563|nr:class I SAM-dependent DNA methyltransferase [Schwartzia succinivorans]MBE6097624.1 SAM-dependent DNA methyltransferase [Schwartzia succinivorans]
MPVNDMKNVIWDDAPVDVTEEVNFIWSIANKLRGPYQSDKYKNVIIPMTIIRRFECALGKTKQDVLDQLTKLPDTPDKKLYKISGYAFYNKSRFTLRKLLNDSDNLAENFKSYLGGFSDNVKNIIANLEFDKEITKMDKHDRLFRVVEAFSEVNLDPAIIDNVKMGYIFEELIRKFSENAEAGDHYTGRDIIKVMVEILLAEGADDIYDEHKVVTILDQACGTGGMLSTAYNWIKRFNDTAEVKLFGQEVNDESYAMCVAEMLIKGQDAEKIAHVDTMKIDSFPGTKMRFVIENPPFGQPWGGKDAAEGVETAVKNEFKKANSRFMAGLPASGDMQLLFMQSAIDKMDETNGRAAIIENGSPLFAGGTASGESQIRRYMLEHDLIEAIIALPTDLFYNTGIATYIWILSKNKRKERQGKIQLIDATQLYHVLRKSLGKKRNEITAEDREQIVHLYADFEETGQSKIFRNTEFMYREYSVMQPLQRSYAINAERIEQMKNKGSLNGIYSLAKVSDLEAKDELTAKESKMLKEFKDNEQTFYNILEALEMNQSEELYMSPEAFKPVLEKVFANFDIDSADLIKIMEGLSKMDKNAEIQRDKKDNIIYDKETKDVEIVKYEEDIDTYMKREVLPHVPDAKAFWEEDLSKKKPVIKTGAEIPFTRYFYKYVPPKPSEDLASEFMTLEQSVNGRIQALFGGAL